MNRIYKHIGIFIFVVVFVLVVLSFIAIAGGNPFLLIPKL
jgi:hypothetical protein